MTVKLLKTSKQTGINPGRDLGRHGAALWKRITEEYDVSDAGGREMLLLACQALDRAESMRAKVDRDGEMLIVRGAYREHPLLKGELSNRAFICKTLLRLGLSVEAPQRPMGRPPVGGLGVTDVDLVGTDDA
jgi:hypothetical protein